MRGAVADRYREREEELSSELLRILERREMLIIIDNQWKDHLLSIDHLKEGIGLRGYGQRDPLTEYKREAFELFQDMVDRVKATVVERLFKVQILREVAFEDPGVVTAPSSMWESRGEAPRREAPSISRHAPPQSQMRAPDGRKVGRNDPCPCGAKNADGSPKKYKRCHGK